MCKSGSSGVKLHPLQVALKKSWERLIVNKGIKQDFLAARCGVDKSTVSRWKDSEGEHFPPTEQMAKFIEALQEWPGVEPWEPIEAFTAYFGCHANGCSESSQPVNDLVGMISATCGKLVQLVIQAQAPNSDGGVDLSQSERQNISPVAALLRRLADDLDDSISAGAVDRVGA